MTPQTRAVHHLMTLRKTQHKVETLPELFRPKTVAEAHAIQAALVAILMAESDATLSGYKVATTSETAQKMLNVDGPFSGQILSTLVYESGQVLQRSDYTAPKAEPEFGFRLASDVPHSETAYTAQTILPFLGDLLPAIEIVDHRFNSLGTAGGNNILADNAIFGCVVIGEPVSDWQADALADHPVSFHINGSLFAEGVGANALGHPLNVMAWLANQLQAQGKQLKAGQLVITGTVTSVHHAEAGDTVVGDFGRYGSVNLSFI